MNTIQSFINTLVPVAQQIQKTYRIPAAVCIAQAALETGWGRSVVGNNYFGIKATPSTGKVVTSPTTEYVNGKEVWVDATFCAYESLADSANEYGIFLTSQARYAPCFNSILTTNGFCFTLQACGYATDPNYAKKLISIINEFKLAQYNVA